jgi:hypothetical protein
MTADINQGDPFMTGSPASASSVVFFFCDADGTTALYWVALDIENDSLIDQGLRDG